MQNECLLVFKLQIIYGKYDILQVNFVKHFLSHSVLCKHLTIIESDLTGNTLLTFNVIAEPLSLLKCFGNMSIAKKRWTFFKCLIQKHGPMLADSTLLERKAKRLEHLLAHHGFNIDTFNLFESLAEYASCKHIHIFLLFCNKTT